MRRLLVPLIALALVSVSNASALAHDVAQSDGTTTTSTTADMPNVAEEPLADEEGEAGSTWLLVLMAIIVAVMVVLAAAFVRGRRPPE